MPLPLKVATEDSTFTLKANVNKHLIRDEGLGVTAALRPWLGPASIAGLCLLLSVLGDSGRSVFRYERSALLAGELWRLLSAHLVHLSFGHVVLNLAALAVMAALLDGVLETAEWFWLGLVAALAIDAGLFLFSPEVQWYVGLSGVLHGWLAAGALRLAFAGSGLGPVLLVGIAAKIAWEQWAGPLPFSESSSGGPVVVDAHLYGALGGAAAMLCTIAFRGRPAKL
jgi:rhomboid family GlyGly-CTERM serine protease